MLELNKKDRRWYKWLSILGFCLLCQELRIIIYYKKKDFNEYFSYIAIIVYLFFVYILVPTIVLVSFMEFLCMYKIIAIIINIFILIYLYWSGYIIVLKLISWAEKKKII